MQVYISRQIHHEQEKKWQIQRCTGHNCVSAIQIDGPLEPPDGSNVTLTCIAKGSLRFTFLNSDNVQTAIGECTVFDDCYLYSSALTGQYEITKTDEGATLTIFNIDRYRFGIYSCSALFNSSLSDSIHIQQKPESMDFTNTCTAFRMRHALSFTEKRPDKNKY
ncbi:uncharacterized protein LOC127858875 isoform X2 [Dreissena polymorpha]|uniref:uncharacterized protein LOC127858875 isoform X2 n=1 Tax=Dreissena polymorpha TaxID=45954 RepID=UPI0022643E76|nr:uncharacterized protein LOC127858875 isoform X2 [Dreissena polymorpha]